MLPPVSMLICHGSRDPHYQAAFTQFVDSCHDALAPYPVVAGQLEVSELSLAEQIILVTQAWASECLIMVPIFMGGGVHVEQDLPAAIQSVQQRCPSLKVIQTLPLGQVPEVITVLETRIQTTPAEAYILLFHGSRHPNFTGYVARWLQPLQAISTLPVVPACWAYGPSLAAQVESLYGQGYRQIQILPFFFFPGGILERVQQQHDQLEHQWPALDLRLAPPLLPDPMMIQAVTRLIQQAFSSRPTQRLSEVN